MLVLPGNALEWVTSARAHYSRGDLVAYSRMELNRIA